MLLCDIGNTSYHFLSDTDDYKEDVNSFNPLLVKEQIFYICVNPDIKTILQKQDNWIDLSIYIEMSKYYETMGIDRIFAIEAISDGIIIDAGSAITVDIVKGGVFKGGFIYPGISAMAQTYKNISSVLEYPFNFELDLDKMPKNSQDAISYGYLKTLYNEVISHNMNIFLTGGDAKVFAKIFKDAQIDEGLIFKGMKKIVSSKSLFKLHNT